MGIFTKPILNLIAERPGIRSIEIADEVGCDEDMIQTFIKEEIDSGAIIVQSVFTVGGRSTSSFYTTEVFSRIQPEQPHTLLFKGASLPDLPPFLDKREKTRTKTAIDFILANDGRVSNAQLKEAMGLKPGQSPTSFLMNPLKNGILDRDGDDWVLGVNHPSRAPINFSCAMRAHGNFIMSRNGKTIAELTADETAVVRHFMKSQTDEVST